MDLADWTQKASAHTHTDLRKKNSCLICVYPCPSVVKKNTNLT